MTVPPRILALPCWSGTPTAEPLHGGLSNESWKVTDTAGAHVVRFGRDFPFHHVDRAREVMSARAAHAAGFAPAIEHAEPGVMVSAFLTARTWGAEDVRANPTRVGALLKRFHHDMQAEVEGPAYLFWPFHVIRDYARTLRADQSRFIPDLPRLLALSAAFEAAQVALPIVYGHHDLLPANFLEGDGRLWLIDYEYAGFGTAMFDLAGAAANAVMQPEEAEDLLGTYFDHTPGAATWRAFDAMQGAALVREAMWAMVSDHYLSAPGVDYVAYAGVNLEKLAAHLELYQSTHGKLTP